ncbi:MAG: hypothetical protein ACRC76_03365 [Proteocatella sp.]
MSNNSKLFFKVIEIRKKVSKMKRVKIKEKDRLFEGMISHIYIGRM